MESMLEPVYLFVCREGHKILRKSEGNPAPCSRCQRPFLPGVKVEPQEGESARTLEYRALTMKVRRVN